jgi:hypothetical protein
MAAASKIVQAAIEVLAKKSGGALPAATVPLKTLPTDEASRMARAREMGHTIEAYKGTYPYDASTGPVYGFKDGKWQQVDRIGAEPDVIKSFNSRNTTEQGGKFAGFFGNVDVANRFAAAGSEGAVFPSLLRMDAPLVIDAGGKPAGAFQFRRMAEDAGTMKDYQAFNDAFAPGSKFDGVILKNTLDEGTVYVPSASNQVRGRFAQFDPAKADSADILAGVGGIAAAGGALSAMGGEARAQEPVNPDDLDPELGMSEQFDRNPLARTGFDPRAVRQLPFKMRGYKAWTSYEDSTNPGLKSIAHGFSRPFSSDDTAMILGIEALPSMDEGGAQLLMHESGHRALRMLNDTEPDLAKLVDTLRQPKTDTHGGLDGEEVLMRMLDFFGGNEDRRADTEKFFKQRTGKDIFPVIQENIDTLTQVQAFFQKKLMEQGRNPGSIEFRTPEDIAASPRQNDPAGAALSQQDGFDYGALSNVAEESNGQRSN